MEALFRVRQVLLIRRRQEGQNQRKCEHSSRGVMTRKKMTKERKWTLLRASGRNVATPTSPCLEANKGVVLALGVWSLVTSAIGN